MSRDKVRSGFSVVGLGAAACLACCAGPIVAFLAATGLFTIAGVATFGLVGLIALMPAAVWWGRRRRLSAGCTVPDEPVIVPLGRRPGEVAPSAMTSASQRRS